MRKCYVVIQYEQMEFKGYQFFNKTIDSIYTNFKRSLIRKEHLKEMYKNDERLTFEVKTEVLM